MENIITIDGKKYKQTIEPIDPPTKETDHFYPGGVKYFESGMKHRWTRDPEGLIIHYHSGWTDARNNSIACLKYGAKQGYSFWCLEEDGLIYMPHGANKQGYHAGRGSGHEKFLGIEVMCNGKLEKRGHQYYSWYGAKIPGDDVRWSNDKDNIVAGYYQKYTKKQEKALIELCLWLKETYPNFSFDNVIGHDECQKGRKQDPGASLSMSMPEFRALLKQTYSSMS